MALSAAIGSALTCAAYTLTLGAGTVGHVPHAGQAPPPWPWPNATTVLFNSSEIAQSNLAPPGVTDGCVGGPVIVQTPNALLAFGTASFGRCQDCQARES